MKHRCQDPACRRCQLAALLDAERLIAVKQYSRERKAMLRGSGVCINGAKHGTATHGVRCERCWLVKKGDRSSLRRVA